MREERNDEPKKGGLRLNFCFAPGHDFLFFSVFAKRIDRSEIQSCFVVWGLASCVVEEDAIHWWGCPCEALF